MSMDILRHIAGDPPKLGFKPKGVGGTAAFPDTLPYFQSDDVIFDNARVQSSGAHGGARRTLAHVWEYQTYDFGRIAILNTLVAVAAERPHGMTELLCAAAGNAAASGTPGQIMRCVREEDLYSLDEFWLKSDPQRQELEGFCWEPEKEKDGEPFPYPIDETWRLTLLYRYWEQASVRAFSGNSPEPVHVCFGLTENDRQEAMEQTIRLAKIFFADIIARGLPRQAQNIASMAAGVNCGDTHNLRTALQFDIAENGYEDETLNVARQQRLVKYRLNDIETAFIRSVAAGEVPAAVAGFFDTYRKKTNQPDIDPLTVPFMADLRVWYGLFCADMIGREGHGFIQRANLNLDQNDARVSDAVACNRCLTALRTILTEEHKVKDAFALLAGIEEGLLRVMAADMDGDSARPFLRSSNELIGFQRCLLTTPNEAAVPVMIHLVSRDQQLSTNPNFIRYYPGVQLRSETANARNGEELSVLLREVVRPLIDRELDKEKIENKYLQYLVSNEFAKSWCLDVPELAKAMAAFLREEYQNPVKHFLLYRISMEYLPKDELLIRTLEIFREQCVTPDQQPTPRMLDIAERGCKDNYGATGLKKECNTALNAYYAACFAGYGDEFSAFKGIVDRLKGERTEALVSIFERYAGEQRLTPEQAGAAFGVLYDEAAVKPARVQAAYEEMLTAQRERMLQAGESPVVWLAEMVKAAPFGRNIAQTDSIIRLLNTYIGGRRPNRDEIENLFRLLGGSDGRYVTADGCVRAFSDMIGFHRDQMLENGESPIGWMMWMQQDMPFTINNAESLLKIFAKGREGERMPLTDARNAHELMRGMSEAQAREVRKAYIDMLEAQRRSALENADETAFTWLNEMSLCVLDANESLLSEQHDANIGLACGISERAGKLIGHDQLHEIEEWARNGQVSAKGLGLLQRYANESLKAGDPFAADHFLPCFAEVTGAYPELKEYAVRRLAESFEAALAQKPHALLSEILRRFDADTKKLAVYPNELYEMTNEAFTVYLNEVFVENADLKRLDQELDQLRQGTEFYRLWLNRLKDAYERQQEVLFNSQPTLGAARALKDEISGRIALKPSLSAAYQLIDSYESVLRELTNKAESDIPWFLGVKATEIARCLMQTGNVRGKLCELLRNEQSDAEKALLAGDFRHCAAGMILHAGLTENGSGRSGEGPDWAAVLKRLIPGEALDAVGSKPYASAHLPLLQRVLALGSLVAAAERATPNGNGWTNGLTRAMHANERVFHYVTLLARDRRNAQLYGLGFDQEGNLIFSPAQTKEEPAEEF